MKQDKLNFTRLQKLFNLLAKQQNPEAIESIMLDICTPAELEAIADRLHVAPMIYRGDSYRRIHEKSKVSITTIGRIARNIQQSHGGYKIILSEERQ